MSLDQFFGIEAPEPKTKLLPPCPPIDEINAAQLQFFDNGNRPRKQGQSRFSMKLELYFADSGINIMRPDWYRIIQLIEPDKVLQWARRKWDDNEIDDDTLSIYKKAHAAATAFLSDGYQVWMGHISDPNCRGKHYYPGQFVLVSLSKQGDMQACVSAHGNAFVCDKFMTSTSIEVGSRKYFSYYDPKGILMKEARERADRAKSGL